MVIDADHILNACYALGFARAGVCRAEPSDYAMVYHDWIESCQHGEMEYLANHVATRVDARKLLPSARSIICVADRYASSVRTGFLPRDTGRANGRVARYARGDDYHRVIKKRLHELCDSLQAQFPDDAFKACVDTVPLLEREHAQRAGLGSIGKHTLIIEKGVGSYLLLGAIVTTLELTSTQPGFADVCGSCTRCIDACPTDAILPWQVDATKCISYLTIEHRSVIDQKFHNAMGDWIFGCDICQDVCPHNQATRRKRSSTVHEAYEQRNATFSLIAILNWSEDDRRAAFERSAMKRAKLFMMKRNALIAAGNHLQNHDDPKLRTAIRQAVNDENEVVRETARQVLELLDG